MHPHAPQYDGGVRFGYAALSVLAFVALMAALVFGAAGRVDLPWVWATIGVCGGMMAAMAATIDPELGRERLRPAPGGEDRHFRLKLLPLLLAMWVVAGLDIRFGWSHVPGWAHALGLALLAAGLGLNSSSEYRKCLMPRL